MSMTTLARRIRAIRYSKGWGPDELADRAKISRTALYQIECGKTETPRAGTLIRIARALGLSVEDLLSADRNPPTELSILRDNSQNPLLGLRPVDGVSARAPKEPGHGGSGDVVYQMLSNQTGPLVFSEGMSNASVGSRNVEQKLRELLDSPLAESISLLIEETYRLLPQGDTRVENWGGQG